MTARTAAITAAAILTLMPAGAARACAPAPPENGQPVRIADESAVIVYDRATGTEHFLRKAVFRTGNRDFGFLVPTPTVPTLAEADPTLFDHLEQTMLPRRERRVRRGLVPTAPLLGTALAPFLASRDSSGALPPPTVGAGAPAPEVRVLSQKRVGEFDATVIEARDEGALLAWLKVRGYAVSPSLRAWLKPYIGRGWKITAYKIAKDAAGAKGDTGDGTVSSTLVRMSFRTDRPFYPYREPADARKGGDPSGRHLRVYYVTSDGERVAGRIGSGEGQKGIDGDALPAWSGTTAWSGSLNAGGPYTAASADPRAALAGFVRLPADRLPTGPLRLTVFDDHSSPRPGLDELYFARAGDQTAISPPPIIEWEDRRVPFPVEVVPLVGVAALVSARRRRERRRA